MKPRAGGPRRPLALLTLAVLGLHWLALREAPGTLAWRPAAPNVSVRLRQPDAAPQAAPAPVDVSRPRARMPAPPTPASRSIAAAPASVVTAPASADTPGGPLVANAVASAAQAPRDAPAPSSPAMPHLAAAPVAIPGSAQWRYEAQAQSRGLRLQGQAQLDWRQDGARYEAALQITVAGLRERTQRSTGALANEGLAPLKFTERLRSEEAAHFDREQARIVFSSNRPAARLRPGAQDRLSVLLQLAALVAGDPARFVPGTTLVLQTAGTREAGDASFTVDGAEELALPGGTLRAFKLTRAPRHEWDPRLELWLAPGPDYGPVRLRLTAPGGDWLDLQWSGTDKR
jgi:hypothetical protein